MKGFILASMILVAGPVMAQECTIQVSVGNSHGIPAGFYKTGARGHTITGAMGYWVRGMLITEASVSPRGCEETLPVDDVGD